MKIAVVSGGFDPLHVGHVRMIRAASTLTAKVIVVLNNTHWILHKKGYEFMPVAERAEILQSLKYVSRVIITAHQPNDEDVSICRELEQIRSYYPDDKIIYCNGGDRKADNIPEYALCKKLGLGMEFNVGGGKAQSSSTLVRNAPG